VDQRHWKTKERVRERERERVPPPKLKCERVERPLRETGCHALWGLNTNDRKKPIHENGIYNYLLLFISKTRTINLQCQSRPNPCILICVCVATCSSATHWSFSETVTVIDKIHLYCLAFSTNVRMHHGAPNEAEGATRTASGRRGRWRVLRDAGILGDNQKILETITFCGALATTPRRRGGGSTRCACGSFTCWGLAYKQNKERQMTSRRRGREA
jgi:hypothetical protein